MCVFDEKDEKFATDIATHVQRRKVAKEQARVG